MDGSAPITRAEHNEFAKRLEEENRRQDKRIELLERSVREIGALTTSVEKLAMSVESMVKEQAKQGERLEALEARDGEKWRKLAGYAASVLVSAIAGFLLAQIGLT
ncbi:MAG TPA: hypothetical protein IAC26_09815 [Candidatus Scatomorpha stercoravium]|nr:hypothetical protein [Candidatus Scatomorpha stercoravium]